MNILLLGISFIDFVSRANIIAAIILGGIGFAVSLLAPKVGNKFGTQEGKNSKTNITKLLRIIGLVLMILGVLLIGIESVTGILSNN